MTEQDPAHGSDDDQPEPVSDVRNSVAADNGPGVVIQAGTITGDIHLNPPRETRPAQPKSLFIAVASAVVIGLAVLGWALFAPTPFPGTGAESSSADSESRTHAGQAQGNGVPAPTDLWWVRVSGPGCGPDNSDSQLAFDPAWRRIGGGWTGDGCDGSALTTTLSPAGERTVDWSFDPVRPVSCQLEVYVPNSPDARGAASYQVFGKDLATVVASPAPVAQADYRGAWVTLGTYAFPEGRISLRLRNSGTGGAPVVASAVRASCALTAGQVIPHS